MCLCLSMWRWSDLARLLHVVEWWSGGVVEWWSGGVVHVLEWWSDGVVHVVEWCMWWSGGVVHVVEWCMWWTVLILAAAVSPSPSVEQRLGRLRGQRRKHTKADVRKELARAYENIGSKV